MCPMKCLVTFMLVLQVMVLGAVACADTPVPMVTPPGVDEDFEDLFGEEDQKGSVSDPLERLNRGIFWFNDKVYFYAAKPVARVFRMVPTPVRTSLGNVFDNLATPIRFFNATMQLKFRDAGTELGRFAINSTVGVLGLFDPARSRFDLKQKDEDFGQTLGHYGIGPGVYIVIPLIGPSNLRDATGTFADAFLDPVYYLVDRKTQGLVAVKAIETVNTLSLDKDTYEAIKRDSLDPYVFIRAAYSQRRAVKVQE